MLLAFPVIVFFLLAGPAGADENLEIFVSIPPQAFFVKAVGGEHVNISVMVKPEKSPATYEPSPRQMTNLARSDLYFAVGVPFEQAWLEKFADANPEMRIVHTEKGIEKRPVQRHACGLRRHGPDKEKGIKDPHIWLSPPLVMLQARRILTGLKEADPENSGDYLKNYQAFINRLADLDAWLMRQLSGISETDFMVYHPSWGYFADAYGLCQIPIEIEGKTPKAREVKELIKTAKNKNIEMILVQPQFSTKQAEIIAREIGGRLAVGDPLAEDWENNIKKVAGALKKELK